MSVLLRQLLKKRHIMLWESKKLSSIFLLLADLLYCYTFHSF